MVYYFKKALAGLIFLLSFSSLNARILLVNELLDPGGPGSLRSQVAAASPGDTVMMNVKGVIALNSPITITNKAITILGAFPVHSVIDCSNLNFGEVAFDINGTAGSLLTIQGFKVTNCNLDAAAIYVQGNSQVKIIDCLFEANTGFYNGQCIASFITGGMVEIYNCSFVNNSATNGGGAIYLSNQARVRNCTFYQNSAGAGANGGAIYTDGNISVSNCTFLNNTAGGSGGSIYQGSGSVELFNNIFSSANVGNELSGTIWNNLGGNVFSASAINDYTSAISLTQGPNDDFTTGFANIGMSGTPTTDGYGLVFFRLNPGSPCINNGVNPGAGYLLNTDCRRAPRILMDGIGGSLAADAGAFEFTPFTVTDPTTGANDFYSTWNNNMNTSGPYSGPRYMDFNIPGAGSYITSGTLFNNNLSAGDDWIVDGFTQQGSVIPGPGTTPNSVTPGTYMVQVTNGTIDMFYLDKGGPGSWISGLSLDQSDNARNTIEVNNVNFRIFGNHIITSDPSHNPNKSGIVLTGSADCIIGGWRHHERNVISGHGFGIYLQSPHVLVMGNFIGTSPNGMSALPNHAGIYQQGGSLDVIGRYGYPSMNLISGNFASQIDITSGSIFKIFGNAIGPDYTRTGLLTTGAVGIYAETNTDGEIGRGVQNGLNVIGGNAEGINISFANMVKVLGNFIGISPEPGFPALPNNNGVFIFDNGDATHLIGDGSFAGRNFISGNGNFGVYVNASSGHTIRGNFIGLKPDNTPGGNGFHGIYVDANSDNLMISDNVISNNNGDGISYDQAGDIDLIQFNKIGTDSTGNTAIGNVNGIRFNNLGGSDIDVNNNQISGNSSSGILITNNSTSVIIRSNNIGLNATMTGALSNSIGINTNIATTLTVNANTIAGNTTRGMYLGALTLSTITGNYIGTNSSMAAGLGNGASGIEFYGSSSSVSIGGTTAGNENTIINNNGFGVYVNSSSNNIGIISNAIHDNADLGISLTGNSNSPLANDTGDGDALGTYGNEGMNYPDNLVVSTCSASTTLSGTMEIEPGAIGNYRLQVFRINPGAVDPTNHGEGNEFVHEQVINFGSAGTQPFSFALPGTILLNDILAVTTSREIGTDFETSEFSDTVIVRGGFTPTAVTNADVSCFGGADGQVSVGVSGGVGPFTYQWMDQFGVPLTGQTSSSATLPAGDYYCDVMDGSNSCVISSNLITINEPPVLTVTPTSVNPLCAGSCDGSIVLSETGGTPPYQYSIDNGSGFQPTNNFTALCAGAYQYLVMDANGCVTPNTGNNISLTSPPAVTLIPSVTDETCSGMNDGTITLSGSGGTPPYTYQVETSGYTTTTLYTGLASNGYNVFVMDANGCIANGFVTVNPGETVTANFLANSGCEDQPVINFTDLSSASSSTISNWNWTFPVGTLPSTTSTLTNPSAISFANSGSNNVQLDVISGNGCTASVILPVTIFQAPVADAGVDDAICEGVAFTHSASITGGTGPLTIDWQPDPGHFVDNTIEDPTILGSLSSTPGVYTHIMNVSDANGCTDADTIILTINANPTVIAPSDYNVCQGNPTTLNGSGTATGYVWDNSVTDGVSFNPSSTLTYTVTGTDGNGCMNTDQVTITVDIPPTVNAGADLDECRTIAFNASLSGSVSNASSTQWTTSGSGSWTNDLMPITTYFYSGADASSPSIVLTLTAYSGNSCADVSDDLTVTFHDAPDAYAGINATVCAGTPIALNGGAVNYLNVDWTNGSGTYNPDNISLVTNYTPSAGEISAGTVNLVLTAYSTNAACPDDDDTITFTLITPPMANAGINSTICNGQSITLDGSSSTGTITNYSWDIAAGANIDTTVVTSDSPTITTDYVLTVDNGTCTDDDTITITVVSSPDASFNYSAAQYCVDAGVQSPMNVMTVGGVFSLPGFSTSINAVTGDLDPSTLPPGNYTVYYTLSTPCTAVDSASVTINGLPDATINGTLYVCVGNNQFDLNTSSSLFPVTTLTGGTWSGTGVGGNFFTPGTAGAGSHIITYSVTDANGCSNSDTASIVVNPAPVVSISGVPNPVCQTDPVFTPIGSPSGGTWLFDGNPVGSSLSIDPDTLTTVTHGISYQYTDPTTGCTATTIPPTGFTVYAVPLDPTTTQPTTQTVCSGATLSLVVSNPNGTGTSLVWYSDAALTNQIAIGPTLNTPTLFNSVTYYVVVQNNGCMSNPIVFDIIVNTANVSAGPDLFICPGTPAQLNVNTSTGTISWSPGASLNDSTVQNPIATPNVNTSYVVTVTSGTCVDVDTVDVVIDGTNPDCGVVPSYNAFSPDGDGVNDNWIIDAAALHPNNHLTIFNRWGDKLVEFQDYDNVNVVWDGKYKGNLLPSGTYYYVIEYLDINIQVSGWLQITH